MVRRSTSLSLCCAAVILAAGTFTPAFADDRVVTGGTNCTLADPASAADTSLTVKKTAPNAYDEIPEGELPAGPIDGMRFTLDRVDIAYSSQEDARVAAKMTLPEAEQRGFVQQYVATTDDKGEARFADVRPGLYRLSETVPDDGEFDYRKSRDILLLLPLVTGKDCTVQYDSVIVAKPEPDPESGTWTPTPPTSGTSTSQTTPTSSSDETPETSRTVATTPRTTTSAPRTRTAVTETPQTTTPRPRTGLAQTGADVLVTVGVGALLVVLGVVLIARRRGNEQ